MRGSSVVGLSGDPSWPHLIEIATFSAPVRTGRLFLLAVDGAAVKSRLLSALTAVATSHDADDCIRRWRSIFSDKTRHVSSSELSVGSLTAPRALLRPAVTPVITTRTLSRDEDADTGTHVVVSDGTPCEESKNEPEHAPAASDAANLPAASNPVVPFSPIATNAALDSVIDDLRSLVSTYPTIAAAASVLVQLRAIHQVCDRAARNVLPLPPALYVGDATYSLDCAGYCCAP